MIALGLLAALAGSKPLRWAVAALALLSAYEIWKTHERRVGAAAATAAIVEASTKAGAEANAKNETVRELAARPGAAERLRSDPATCRDCGRALPGLATPKRQ